MICLQNDRTNSTLAGRCYQVQLQSIDMNFLLLHHGHSQPFARKAQSSWNKSTNQLNRLHHGQTDCKVIYPNKSLNKTRGWNNK